MASTKNTLFPHHTSFIFAWSLFQDVPSIYLITEINQGIRSRKASGKNEKLFVVSDKGIHLKFYFTFTSSFPLASVQHSLSFFKLSSSVSFEARSGSSSWSNDIANFVSPDRRIKRSQLSKYSSVCCENQLVPPERFFNKSECLDLR